MTCLSKNGWCRLVAVALVAVLGVLPAAADSVQLANGDVISGKVVSLDDKTLKLESETLGQVNIPRVKIATITLGDARPPAVANIPAPGGQPSVPAVVPKPGLANVSPEGILKQLQSTGVGAKELSEVQKMFPLLASPEASSYFNDTLKGLMGGGKSIGDVRKDAIRARDELKKATKGLGPDVDAAVAPYLNILERFIGETQPTEKKAPAKK